MGITEAQRVTVERIEQWLTELFGRLHVRRLPDQPAFEINYHSTLIRCTVRPWTDGEATIQNRAVTVYGPHLELELLRYLLQENTVMRFGAFGVDEDSNVIFTHTIVGGERCDQLELESSIQAVAQVADSYAAYIAEQWGGITPREYQESHRAGA